MALSNEYLIDPNINPQTAPEGEPLFIEDYVPFDINEICGGDMFDEDGEVPGILNHKEQAISDLQKSYQMKGQII